MKQVLIIDDQKINLTTISAIVTSNIPGCSVLTAMSGKEGIEIAKEHQPSIIILDIIMPEMDGYEVCERLKKDNKTKSIPVMMITANEVDTESRVKGLTIGADAFLSRPIDFIELSTQVKVMLRIKDAEEKLRIEKQQLDQKVKERTKELSENENKLKFALKKAEESDRLKSTFLTCMSHELRTPLNAIIGFSELIHKEPSITEIKEYNKTIQSSGQHLLSIVENLFDLSLVEADQIKPDYEDFDVNSVLKSTEEILKIEQQKLDKNHIKLNLNIPENTESLFIRSDKTKLKQILINLLKNALKFTNTGYINFGYELIEGNSFIRLFIEDSGIGIPKDKKDIIFESFRQIEDSNTREIGGAGIGLTLSKKLVELLGGELNFKSEVDQGSRFNVIIPIEKLDNKPIEDHKEPEEEFKTDFGLNKHLLIVEDDTSSFDLLNIILKKYGFKITRAENGIEAIEIFKNTDRIHLVLMDLRIPKLDGYEAAKEIHKLNANIPIIAQTAHTTIGVKEKILSLGFADYISKPINKKVLLEKINKHI